MYKQKLRFKHRKKRDALLPSVVNQYSLEIANKVIQLPIWGLSFYHTFLSIRKNREVDTLPLLSLLQGKDKNIVIPRVVSQRKLKHYLLTDGTSIRTNHLGIPEPEGGIEITESQIDVIFVPLLAFDLNGHRVGYGGGFYDAFLKKCRPEAVKIGLSFFEAVAEIEDSDENDVQLNYCVTPKKIYEF